MARVLVLWTRKSGASGLRVEELLLKVNADHEQCFLSTPRPDAESLGSQSSCEEGDIVLCEERQQPLRECLLESSLYLWHLLCCLRSQVFPCRGVLEAEDVRDNCDSGS